MAGFDDFLDWLERRNLGTKLRRRIESICDGDAPLAVAPLNTNPCTAPGMQIQLEAIRNLASALGQESPAIQNLLIRVKAINRDTLKPTAVLLHPSGSVDKVINGVTQVVRFNNLSWFEAFTEDEVRQRIQVLDRQLIRSIQGLNALAENRLFNAPEDLALLQKLKLLTEQAERALKVVDPTAPAIARQTDTDRLYLREMEASWKRSKEADPDVSLFHAGAGLVQAVARVEGTAVSNVLNSTTMHQLWRVWYMKHHPATSKELVEARTSNFIRTFLALCCTAYRWANDQQERETELNQVAEVINATLGSVGGEHEVAQASWFGHRGLAPAPDGKSGLHIRRLSDLISAEKKNPGRATNRSTHWLEEVIPSSKLLGVVNCSEELRSVSSDAWLVALVSKTAYFWPDNKQHFVASLPNEPRSASDGDVKGGMLRRIGKIAELFKEPFRGELLFSSNRRFNLSSRGETFRSRAYYRTYKNEGGDNFLLGETVTRKVGQVAERHKADVDLLESLYCRPFKPDMAWRVFQLLHHLSDVCDPYKSAIWTPLKDAGEGIANSSRSTVHSKFFGAS